MAPIRRYLRITKYSVLEVRIYLDNPALSETWLLRRGDPALPRIIEAVRPLVLPKLREENERAKGKGKGKRGVKDVVAQEDFEVSIFLTELSSRHSLLTKQKHFEDKPRLKSNSGKLTNWLTAGTAEQPFEVAEDEGASVVVREEEDEGLINLDDIPEAAPSEGRTKETVAGRPRRNKRQRQGSGDTPFLEDATSSDSDAFQTQRSQPRAKRNKRQQSNDVHAEDEPPAEDDKKKMFLNTIYDGFSIYGRILCLVAKRKGTKSAGTSGGPPLSSGQQMMENWVSTQAAQEQAGDEEDDG